MWSEGFAAEERAARTPGRAALLAACGGGVLAACAIVAEILFSIELTSQEVTARGGSWVLAVLALGLGFAGPYAAILAWRAPRQTDNAVVRRLSSLELVVITVAAVALAWLLLLHSSLQSHPKFA
jgi:hypothetical protein